jgi:hypothetical protein
MWTFDDIPAGDAFRDASVRSTSGRPRRKMSSISAVHRAECRSDAPDCVKAFGVLPPTSRVKVIAKTLRML